jgi:hypothetical protein
MDRPVSVRALVKALWSLDAFDALTAIAPKVPSMRTKK